MLLKLINKKFCFKINSKCDLLILDNKHSNIIFKNIIFKSEDFKEINFYYVFKTFFYFFFIDSSINYKLLYKKLLLESYNPKIILDHWLTGNISLIKKFLPSAKLITYSPVFLEFYNNSIKKLFLESYKASDYFLIFSNKEIKNLKKLKIFNKKKVLVTGSLKINEIVTRKLKPKYDILYISQFIFNNTINKIDQFLYNFIEHYIIQTINEYCKLKKKKFAVILRSYKKQKNNKKNLLEETSFIKKIEENLIFEDKDSLESANQARLVIANTSNLGLELMALRKNVLFLPLLYKSNPFDRHKFFKILKKEKAFFKYKEDFIKFLGLKKKNVYTEFNKVGIFKKIDFFLNQEIDNFNCTNKNKLIYYDFKNSILKKLVKNLIYK